MKIIVSKFLPAVLFAAFCLFPLLTCGGPETAAAGAAGIQRIETDKACYSPGDTVRFTLQLNKAVSSAELQIRYYHLNSLAGEQTVSLTEHETSAKWKWLPPPQDDRGYLAEVAILRDTQAQARTSAAVDVSSGWRKFPRYGFVSRYPAMSGPAIDSVIASLNRYHINGLQFYDWHYKHHRPLAGTADAPDSVWRDIAGRINHLSTIEAYIRAAQRRNMKTMAYNLLYGAWEDGPAEGVSREWRIFRDSARTTAAKIDFDEGWSSDIYLMNPANPAWQEYIFREMGKVFRSTAFDGWHVDQLGDWGPMWTFSGQPLALDSTFDDFLTAASRSLGRPLVMNAVGQYGQRQIADAPVEFLYSEVWDPDSSYTDLVRIIEENDRYGGDSLRSVLAAYVNQGIAEDPGQANSAAVLLADAVIFAAGGAHLELGEHLLVHPYFPNNNLAMPAGLREKLRGYYDFLVAYQNLLREGVSGDSLPVPRSDAAAFSREPLPGKVWFYGRRKAGYRILHLVNFTGTATALWRDNRGIQCMPEPMQNVGVTLSPVRLPEKIWLASPDFDNGLPREIEFRRDKDGIRLTLPRLHIWNMLVLEY